MIHTVDGWRYWYRRYLGWLPVQFCMVCGKPYWGGFPYPSKWLIWPWKWTLQWQASWMDYCSRKCSDEDDEDFDVIMEEDFDAIVEEDNLRPQPSAQPSPPSIPPCATEERRSASEEEQTAP